MSFIVASWKPLRANTSDRNVWRTALGFRGDLGDASERFLRALTYDIYYSFARTEETSHQEGNASRSRFQQGLLSVGGAAPVVNPFGQNISDAGVTAIGIGYHPGGEYGTLWTQNFAAPQ